MVFRRRGRGERERTGTPADLLAVGLGNPGADYTGTRHNVGAEVVDLLAERHGGRLRSSKEAALADEVRVGELRLALAFPQTFYNRAGESVRALVRRHGITELDRLVVVHDELDLPTGRIKVKLGGGLAGNNGLKSIRDHLKSTEFVRIRIGVDKPPGSMSGADWVLRRPGRKDREILDDAVERAADAVEAVLAEGVTAAMNDFNRS